MALKTRDELLDDLTTAVRSDGRGGKTTAQDLRTFLTSLIDEILGHSAELSLPLDLVAALAGTAGVPSDTNRFVTATDPRLNVAPANASVLEFVFESGFADAVVRTMGNRQANLYQTEQLQNVAAATYRVNGTTVVLPFTVNSGDALAIGITRISAELGAVVSLES